MTAPAEEAAVPVAVEASAAERVDGLTRLLGEARANVAALEARAIQADDAAAAAYRRADGAAGDAASVTAQAARADLVSARERLTALEEAARHVAAEAQRDRWQQQAAELRQQESRFLDERDAEIALVRPALAACKAAIIRARTAEHAASRVQDEAARIEAELTGVREQGGVRFAPVVARHNRVAAVVDASALLIAVERTTEV